MDSLAPRRFVSIALDEYTPDHSTIWRTRRSIRCRYASRSVRLGVGRADRGLLKGVRIVIDAATLDETQCEAGMAVAERVLREAELRPNEAPQVNVAGIEEKVTDKGYSRNPMSES